MNFLNFTEGPWWMDASAIAGTFTAFALIWRYALWPFARGAWAAIVAAPRVADGVLKLVDLVEGDVMDRLDRGNSEFERIGKMLDDHEVTLSVHDGRLTTLEGYHHMEAEQRSR